MTGVPAPGTPVRASWMTAVALLVAALAPSTAAASKTSLHVTPLDAVQGSTLTIVAAIDGAREGDTIRLFALRVAPPPQDSDGQAAEEQPAIERVALDPPTLVTGRRSISARVQLVAQRGLYRFLAAYIRDGHAVMLRRSLVSIDGPPDLPTVYDDLPAQPGAVTGHDLATLRASLRRDLSRTARARAHVARAAASTQTAAFRVTPPQGRYRDRKPKGLVVIVHGGGWYGGGAADRSTYSLLAGKAYLDSIAVTERRWNRRGYETLNVDYHSGHSSRSDVTRFVKVARATRPDLRICMYGESAGGNLSLLTAGRSSLRNRVACVVSAAGPTDLLRLPDVADGGTPHTCDFAAFDTYVRCLTEGWFGSSYLDRWSPAQLPNTRRILAAEARNDEIVPPSQGTSLRRALGAKRVTHLILKAPASPQDSVEFLHGTTTRAELRRYFKAERAFVDRATKPPRRRR